MRLICCGKQASAREQNAVPNAQKHVEVQEEEVFMIDTPLLCDDPHCDGQTRLIGCTTKCCYTHCTDRRCPIHLPVHLLRRNTDQILPPLKMVNGIWVIESAKNVDGNAFAADMRGIINPFETPEDVEHFRSTKKRLAAEYAECCICFEPMCLEPLCVLLDAEGNRACSHIHHVRCIDGVTYNAPKGCMFNCPFCREEFMSFGTLPSDFLQHTDEYWKLVAGSRERLPWREVKELIPCIVPVDPVDVATHEAIMQRKYCALDGSTDANCSVSQEEFLALIQTFAREMAPQFEEIRQARVHRTTAIHMLQASSSDESLAAAPKPSVRRTRMVRPILSPYHESFIDPPRVDQRNWFAIWKGSDGKMTCCELIRALTKTLDPECTRGSMIEMAVRAMWQDLDRDAKGHITQEDFDGESGNIVRAYFRLSNVQGTDLLSTTKSRPVAETRLSTIQFSDIPAAMMLES